MKYVIVETTLLPMAIIVPEIVQHKDAVNPKINRPLSAGFFSIVDGCIRVDNRGSESLGIGPRPGDEDVIAMTLAVNSVKLSPGLTDSSGAGGRASEGDDLSTDAATDKGRAPAPVFFRNANVGDLVSKLPTEL